MKNKLKSSIIHTIAVNYILENDSLDINIEGTDEELLALKEVLDDSKKLYNTLKSKNYTSSQLNSVLEQKNKSAVNFKKKTDIDWML